MSARASTDQETAPLLDPTSGAHIEEDDENVFTRKSRALTTVEQGLAILAIALLLLAATFIGLFAGTASQLKKARDQPEVVVTRTLSGSTHTHTATTTSTVTAGHPAPTGGKDQTTCLTRDCVVLASEILKSIDETVDPCEDFYQFSNGGWLNSHSIPSDRGVYGSFTALQDDNRKVILAILEGEDEKPKKDDSPAQLAEKANLLKLRTGYKTCMNEKELNRIGIEPILPLINELTDILGPFVLPGLTELKEDADLSEDDQYHNLETRSDQDVVAYKPDASRQEALTRALAYTHARGVGALFDFDIESDPGNDDPQIQGLSFSQGSGGLPSKEYYEEKSSLQLYTSVVTDVLYAIHNSKEKKGKTASWTFPWPKPSPQEPEKKGKNKKAIKALAKKVVQFERALIRAGAHPERLSNPLYAYNPYEFHNLSKELDFMSLSAYVSSFAPRNFPSKVVVSHPPFIHSLRKILANTPDHVLSAYFVTRVGLSYSKFLGPATPIRVATRKLQVALQGLEKGVPENRQFFCQSYADELEGLGLIGGKEFVDRTFAGDSKEKAESVIYHIIDAFKARIPDFPWMDKESTKAAAKKAETLYVKIGYPTSPNTTDPLALNAYYSRLTIDDDFFANGLRQRTLSKIREWSKLGMLRNRGEWLMQPQLVNAYYNPPDSEIVFPAGILRDPFFSADWPLHLQYGAFGSVAAHELTHAFDNSGAQYDERGRLRDWWTNSTVKGFNEKAQCVAKQYSEYSITAPDGKAVHINGNMTNGEDLGDSGIIFAYEAWKKAASEQKLTSQRLPGLNFTDEQLFFIAGSRVWAQLIKPESALARLRTDPHSPNEWRSRGQVSGFKKFAEAFQCKKGSAMNPKERCDVWGSSN